MDYVVPNNIKTNNNQRNEAIKNYPKFDNIFSLSIGIKYSLPVVNVNLRGGKKQRENIISGLTCLWDSGATYSMIKRKHAEYYERKMRYNEVEYSISSGLYCATHDVKVIFCMP